MKRSIQTCIYLLAISVPIHCALVQKQDPTTRQFANWLRTLGDARTPTGTSSGKTTSDSGATPSRKKPIFNVSGRFTRPKASTSTRSTRSRQPSASMQIEAIEDAPSVTPLEFVVQPTSRLQEDVDVIASVEQALAVAEHGISDDTELKTHESHHTPLAIPYMLTAPITALQTQVIAVPSSAATMVAAVPFFSGKIAQDFEDRALAGELSPAIHVSYDPSKTKQYPHGSMRINTYQEKESATLDVTDFKHLNTVIPRNYLPIFTNVSKSRLPINIIFWRDPSSTTQAHDIKAQLEHDNLVGVYITAPIQAAAITHEETATTPQVAASLQEQSSKPATVSSGQWPGDGYQRMINAYKAQRKLVKAIERFPQLQALRTGCEETLITIARMLAAKYSPESTHLLRSSGVDIPELLSWVSVID